MPQLDKNPGPNDTYDANGNGPEPPQGGQTAEGDDRMPSGALVPAGMRQLPADPVGPVEAATTQERTSSKERGDSPMVLSYQNMSFDDYLTHSVDFSLLTSSKGASLMGPKTAHMESSPNYGIPSRTQCGERRCWISMALCGNTFRKKGPQNVHHSAKKFYMRLQNHV